MNNRIALAMIVGGAPNEDKNLDRALASVYKYVDGIYITLTGSKKQSKPVEQVCKKYNANISYHRATHTYTKEEIDKLRNIFGWEPESKEGMELFMFDVARNYNFDQIPQEYDWILWLDADDVVLRAENLRKVADIGAQANIEAFYFEYLYQVELNEDSSIKHILIKHLRERLVRNIGAFKWIAPIHETLIEQRPTRKTDIQDVAICHLATDEDRMGSLQRNLKNLEYAILQSEGKDPRHIYYLAKAFFDLSTPEYNEKALKLIMNGYVGGENPSGWPEERAQAWSYVGEVYRRKEEYNNAIKSTMNSLIEDPEQPQYYLALATNYMYKGDWERALFWVKVSSTIPEKKTTLVVNPKDVQTRTLEIIYNCSVQLGKIDNAWAAAVKLKELHPDDPTVENTIKFIQSLKDERDVSKSYVTISNYLKKTNERAKIKALLSSAPERLNDNPFLIDLRKKNIPPKVWGKDEIAIYCGAGFTTWGPTKLINPGDSFVGGSEEAVILMAQSLQKLGWKVTVYNDPGEDEGEHDGVTYLSYFKFNRDDIFNILIGWRDIRFFDTEFRAKKTYLWCHDIQNPIEYTKERLDRITKVFFLSKWHRENVVELSEDKVMITSNGI